MTAASVTVNEFLNRWIEHIGPTRSSTTVRGYKAKAKRISAADSETSWDLPESGCLVGTVLGYSDSAAPFGHTHELVFARHVSPRLRSNPFTEPMDPFRNTRVQQKEFRTVRSPLWSDPNIVLLLS